MADAYTLIENSDPAAASNCLNAGCLAINEELAGERDLDSLLRRVLDVAMASVPTDGGVMFRVVDRKELKFINARTISLDSILFADDSENMNMPGIPLRDSATGQVNHFHAGVHVAISGEAIEFSDIFQAKGFDFTGTRKSDKSKNYRTKAMRIMPIKDSEGDVVAVLQLNNPMSPDDDGQGGFSYNQRLALRNLISFTEVHVQNRLLLIDQQLFVESFIQVLARAIDAKSPHAGNHCQKVPIINELLVEAACAETDGPFADFSLSAEEKNELRVAAWMHDCGKIAVPDHIMTKSSRLDGRRDGVQEIATRIEIVKRDLKLAAQRRISQNPHDLEKIQRGLEEKLSAMNRNLTYIMSINYAATVNDPGAEPRIRAIASIKWIDWNGFELPLLAAHEVEALLVKVGTLTQGERQIMEQHASLGIEMMEHLCFPKNLSRVREITGAHHERMDGTGYPNKLLGHQMPVEARMLAVADIFEALTASDRPYKRQKTLNQTIAIMSDMRDNGHIDGDVFELFLKSKVWLEYAVRYMPLQAIDTVTVENYRRRPGGIVVNERERLAAE